MKSPEEIALEGILKNNDLCKIVAFLLNRTSATHSDIHTYLFSLYKVTDKMNLLIKKGIVAEQGGLYYLNPLIALEAQRYKQFKEEPMPSPPYTKY